MTVSATDTKTGNGKRTAFIVQEYLRPHKKFPSVWCPGCGDGIVLGSILRAVHDQGWKKEDVAMVSGIGCSGRMPVYADFNTLHTTHGRALAFATGLKLAKPRLNVIVIMGDGDALAIGGNHFIHTCRRNINLTAVVVNNRIYGMTGGQCSPTTPTSFVATTSTYGNIDQPFDISYLAEAAGASFVGRSSVAHPREIESIMNKALQNKGFSVVEVFSNCHTYFGRMNRLGTAPDMIKWFKENTAPASLPPEKREGKLTRGVFVDREITGFIDHYQELIEKSRFQAEKVLEERERRSRKTSEKSWSSSPPKEGAK
jgi:2-oxoglutarate ferredoxin oxidoreductase subunit beta